jgi:hypothetical protein
MEDSQKNVDGAAPAGADAEAAKDRQNASTRHTTRPPLVVRRRSTVPSRRTPNGQSSGGRPASLDWPAWLQLIERKRRLLTRQQSLTPISPTPIEYLVQATASNFKLDGIALTPQEVTAALERGPAGRKFRSRTAQRIRNHVAILHSIENAIRIGQPLKTSAIIRWYTSISSGLSMTSLGSERMSRLDQIARKINSPQLRLQPAIQDIIRAHRELLIDPAFPSFNGILSRLLLRYHLGRCNLPFVIFDDANVTIPASLSEVGLTLQLLTAIDRSYEMLLH